MHNHADVIIIGGGCIGTGCAYYLAKSGRRVIVLERGEICDGAAGATDGIIALHTKTPGIRLKMGMISAAMFPALLDDLNDSCEYIPNAGGYIVCENDEEFELVSKQSQLERMDGLNSVMLDISDFLKLEPNVNPAMRGCKYVRETALINPFRLAFAYMKRASQFGATAIPFAEVIGFIRKGDRVVGVQTVNGEDYYADMTIDCTGAWSGTTNRMLNLDIPIRPRRGQIIISEPVGKFVTGAFATATYIAIKYFPEKMKLLEPQVQRLGNGFGIEQTQAGTLMIASTRELVGFDKCTTLEGIETILKSAVKYMPKLKYINFIRTFSGFRPACEDGQSVLGGIDGLDGYMICAGHEGDGISMSPLVCKMVLQYLNGEETDFDISMFSPNRFLA